MIIAIDYDKTYDANPKLFERIAERFQAAGHQVGILTARHENEGAPTDFPADFTTFLDCGDLPYDARAITKSAYMVAHNIDMIFDDRADLFPSHIVAINILELNAQN